MTIIIEILENQGMDNLGDELFEVIKSKTVEISTIKNPENIQRAKDKLLQLKSTLPANQKIRVLEYHNDDPDETRQPCKILFEG